jgi:hypothetical protein
MEKGEGAVKRGWAGGAVSAGWTPPARLAARAAAAGAEEHRGRGQAPGRRLFGGASAGAAAGGGPVGAGPRGPSRGQRAARRRVPCVWVCREQKKGRHADGFGRGGRKGRGRQFAWCGQRPVGGALFKNGARRVPRAPRWMAVQEGGLWAPLIQRSKQCLDQITEAAPWHAGELAMRAAAGATRR